MKRYLFAAAAALCLAAVPALAVGTPAAVETPAGVLAQHAPAYPFALPSGPADGFDISGSHMSVAQGAAEGDEAFPDLPLDIFTPEPTASSAPPAQSAASAEPVPAPADWVHYEKFGVTFAAPPDFTVQTDDAEMLKLWSGPQNPRISTPGFSITMTEIDEDAFDRYESVFVKATERFEVDLGHGAVFKAKRLIQGSDGVPYGHLTLAALSKEPIAGDKHLVITIASTRIEPETALPLMDTIFATFKTTGPLGGIGTGDVPVGAVSGATTYEKFGLSFAAPPGFTTRSDNDRELVVADDDFAAHKGCALSVFVKKDDGLYDGPPTLKMEALPNRILGQDLEFKGARLSGTMYDAPMAGLVIGSTEPVEDGRYMSFALFCVGQDAGRADQMADTVLPSLRYVKPAGTAGVVATPAEAAPPAAQPASPAPPAPKASAAADPAVELAFWETIRGSSDPADFQAYLDQFPNGVFAALARNKMKRLGEGGASEAAAPAPSPTPKVAANPAAQAASPQGGIDYAGEHSWTYYYNDRYGTSIAYPADIFVPQAPPTNNDGRRFVSSDGLASFYVFAEYNALAQSLAELYSDDQTRAGEQVTYKKMGSGWFVVSGYRGSGIFYRKTTLSSDDLVQVFETFYQTGLAQAFNPIVTRMAQSFPGSAADPGNGAGAGTAAPNPPPSSSSSVYHTPARGTDERKAIMNAARGPVSNDIGQTVIFAVKVLRSDGHWAYLQAIPVQPNGNPLNWNQTRYAADWQADVMSDVVMVLLAKQNGQWKTVDHIVGPTDVYWYSWIDQYSLPQALFGG